MPASARRPTPSRRCSRSCSARRAERQTLNVTTAAFAVQLLEMKGSNNVSAASNGINKLYAQLLGTKLNGASGADISSVSATIAAADAFLASNNSLSWSGLSNAQKADRARLDDDTGQLQQRARRAGSLQRGRELTS